MGHHCIYGKEKPLHKDYAQMVHDSRIVLAEKKSPILYPAMLCLYLPFAVHLFQGDINYARY
jgi:hypothetical protein